MASTNIRNGILVFISILSEFAVGDSKSNLAFIRTNDSKTSSICFLLWKDLGKSLIILKQKYIFFFLIGITAWKRQVLKKTSLCTKVFSLHFYNDRWWRSIRSLKDWKCLLKLSFGWTKVKCNSTKISASKLKRYWKQARYMSQISVNSRLKTVPFPLLNVYGPHSVY